MDLLSADLFTGACCIFKQGAAASYVRQGEALKCAVGTSLPAGLIAGEKPDEHSFRGQAGTLAVLISDGILCGRGDGWLRDLLADASGGEPQKLADAILQASRRETAGEDDGAVMVLSLGEAVE